LVALVTGASRGIGREVSLALAREGAAVAVNCKSRLDLAEEVRGLIRDMGRRTVAVAADVSRPEDVARLVATVKAELGPVDILVNNAGIARPQALEDISLNDWNEVLAANLTSAFMLTQAVLPDMRAKGFGRIVNISSVAAQLGGVVGPHYAASKAGMLGLTHGFATFLAREGITVNAVAPALIESDMARQLPPSVKDRVPMGRLGLPPEVALAVVMLVQNGFMTGQTVNVNGGMYMT
jgi:3-oxoacyl-[acyl-carrier protein] reductase